MKRTLFIIAILSVVAGLVNAQTYGTTHTPATRDYQSVQSQQAVQNYQTTMQTGNAYNGTVYEPFNNATPSEYSEVGGGSSEDNKPEKPGRVRRDFIDPSNPGNQSNEFPIGDAMIPMLLFAAAFVGVIYYRRRKVCE